MNTTASDFLTHHDREVSLRDGAPEALSECIARLDYEARYALWKYWDRLVWEECVPPSERVERVPSFAELDERRAERRIRRLSTAAADEGIQAPQGDKANTGSDAA